jgi:hypothetical protein
MVVTILWIILLIYLIMMFVGPLSFIFYFFGFLFNLFQLPLDLLSSVYPMSVIPFIFYNWVLFFIVFYFVIRMIFLSKH